MRYAFLKQQRKLNNSTKIFKGIIVVHLSDEDAHLDVKQLRGNAHDLFYFISTELGLYFPLR